MSHCHSKTHTHTVEIGVMHDGLIYLKKVFESCQPVIESRDAKDSGQ